MKIQFLLKKNVLGTVVKKIGWSGKLWRVGIRVNAFYVSTSNLQTQKLMPTYQENMIYVSQNYHQMFLVRPRFFDCAIIFLCSYL